MKSKLIHEQDGERTFALVFETGDEAMAGLARVRPAEGLGAARFTAIGAFQRGDARLLRLGDEGYQKIPVNEQVEVLSLVGDVALKDGEPRSTPTSSSAGPTARRGAAICSRPTSGRRWR